jgi:hypothetical protein
MQLNLFLFSSSRLLALLILLLAFAISTAPVMPKATPDVPAIIAAIPKINGSIIYLF